MSEDQIEKLNELLEAERAGVRTLASLADLRDRGAISPEEYERKKADLLSRL